MQGNDKHWILYNESSEEGQGGYGQEDVAIHTAYFVVTIFYFLTREVEIHTEAHYMS